jgi:flagellar hook-length control protein FliK
MFIFNNLENLIFSKTPTDEAKKDSIPLAKGSSFNEILHQAVNDAARLDSDKLQTYSAISQDITEKREANLNSPEPFNAELFNERISRDIKQTLDTSSTSYAESISNNSSISTHAESEKSESTKIVDVHEYSQNSNSSLKTLNKNDLILEEEMSTKSAAPKDISAEILLQAFAKLDTEKTFSKDAKTVSRKVDLESKQEEKISSSDLKNSRLEGQTAISPKWNSKDSEVKDAKKLDTKIVSGETSISKAKDLKVEIDSKEITLKEMKREVLKDSERVAKGEDTPKLSQTQVKIKESTNLNQKISSEAKPEISNLNSLNISTHAQSTGKEEVVASALISIDPRKTKKNSELESKDKSSSENLKPVMRDFSGIEKDFRIAKETLVEVSGLDKNKWTITRREKEVEHANLERKKESISLLNEIALKSSSSQTSSDSDKSFSNPRYETNGLKTFNESMKTANADKPREAGFDRENFSKSLNDLVSKARINIVENGKNSAQISLYPKDLGKMTLNIDVTKEKVDGKILVDSEFIKNRLLGDVSQLKADLKASGLDLQSISIEVRNQSSLAFDFANPSNEKESSRGKSEGASSALPQFASLDNELESEFSQKSYNLVDIKI